MVIRRAMSSPSVSFATARAGIGLPEIVCGLCNRDLSGGSSSGSSLIGIYSLRWMARNLFLSKLSILFTIRWPSVFPWDVSVDWSVVRVLIVYIYVLFAVFFRMWPIPFENGLTLVCFTSHGIRIAGRGFDVDPCRTWWGLVLSHQCIGETLGRWCSQYEFIGLNAGPSSFVCLLMIPVTRPGLVEFAWSWHSICGMFLTLGWTPFNLST